MGLPKEMSSLVIVVNQVSISSIDSPTSIKKLSYYELSKSIFTFFTCIVLSGVVIKICQISKADVQIKTLEKSSSLRAYNNV